MKPLITPLNDGRYGDLISLASELTRGIPRDLRASLAASIREQCISAMTMLALRDAGSRQVPDDAELLSRLTAIQIVINAAHAKRMIPDRVVRRMTQLLDRIRKDIRSATADDPAPVPELQLAAPILAADPAMPTFIGGQRR